jgi:glutamate racemase
MLACTHYPAISDVLKEFVSQQTVFIDPASELANRVRRWKLLRGGPDVFVTTGDAAKMKAAAYRAFGVKIDKILHKTI